MKYSYNGILLSNEKELRAETLMTLKTCQVKIYTRIHTVWLHLYEVLEQANLIYGENKILTGRRNGRGAGTDWVKKFSDVMELFHSLPGVCVTQLYVKTHQVEGTFVHFAVNFTSRKKL